MRLSSILPVIAMLVTHYHCQNKLYFYMDENDRLEVNYNLLLKQLQMANDLEARSEGPFEVWMPTDMVPIPYSNMTPDKNGFPIEKIKRAFHFENNIFYLYR